MVDPAELCAYCVTAVLTAREKPEHPLPAATGASLTVDTSCDPCNEWAGREIDQPFMAEDLIRAHRSLVDQRDPRRGPSPRRTPSPLLRGHTADGDYVAYDHELQRPVMGSRIVDLGNGRVQVRAGSQEEAERLMRKVRDRAAAEHKEARVEEEDRDQARPEIKAKIVLRTDLWRRMAAKIGLSVGSRVYPPEWRLSEDAQRLRDWMHNRDPSTPGGTAPPLVPTPRPAEWSLARADEHLVFFMRLNDGATYVTVVLFGSSCFAVPVDTTGKPVPTQAWRLDWRKPDQDGLTTFDHLVEDAIMRGRGESGS